MLHLPGLTQTELGRACLNHLQLAVAIDSQSDESSTAVPTTPGQQVLSDTVAAFYRGLGLEVEQDAMANVLAALPGRGDGAGQEPIALMVHLDTARGTEAAAALRITEAWDGSAVAFLANPELRVDTGVYPAIEAFVGHDLVHGDGEAPFGLDDKLGLAHCMTLARMLVEQPPAHHVPVVFIGRPDEEVGRVEALDGVITMLQARGVTRGYTVDGIEALEVNTENFNAGGVRIAVPLVGAPAAGGERLMVRLDGVNTHGATAAAEGYRSAVRLAAELQVDHGVAVTGFQSDALRDCDALVVLRGERAGLVAALDAVVGPHRPRGACWTEVEGSGPREDGAVARALGLAHNLLFDQVDFPVPAEASSGRQGYTNPYRLRMGAEAAVLDIRVRDFDAAGITRRRTHLEGLLARHELKGDYTEQYQNMGPRLAEYPELLAWAVEAGRGVGPVRHLPIRGGTGVDPFLDAGIGLANLGTGYFAPESEKELTSLQVMGAHAQWLYRLVQVVADS